MTSHFFLIASNQRACNPRNFQFKQIEGRGRGGLLLTFKIRLAFQVEGIREGWAERILIFCIPDFSVLPIIMLLV